MKLSPLQRRAERKSRNKMSMDMNLVSLIDIFTILLFFLLSSATGVEILTSTKAVKLPESSADKTPKETVVIVVAGVNGKMGTPGLHIPFYGQSETWTIS